MDKELLKKAESGDKLACFELGMSYLGRNYALAQQWLYRSADMGYIPAMLSLADLYTSKKRSVDELTDEKCTKLNNYACLILAENTKENKRYAYQLFKYASSKNDNALKSLIYCKFEGIGVKKNLRDAFSMLLDTDFGNTFVVLKSDSTAGISFITPKSKVERSVKRRQSKDSFLSLLRLVIGIVFLGPAFLVLYYAMDNENSIRANGGYEVEESLRGNAAGGACLAILAGMVWSFLVFAGTTFLVLYFCGIKDYLWLFTLLIPIPLELGLLTILRKLFFPKKKRR